MPMTPTEILAAMNFLTSSDLYDVLVKGNTLLHQRKVAAAREAQRKVDACEHQWQGTADGLYYPRCGVTRTEPRGD